MYVDIKQLNVTFYVYLFRPRSLLARPVRLVNREPHLTPTVEPSKWLGIRHGPAGGRRVPSR